MEDGAPFSRREKVVSGEHEVGEPVASDGSFADRSKTRKANRRCWPEKVIER